MIAATQRQTAAPVANVKSEIHMRASLVLFSARGNCVRERAVNAQLEYPFPELCGYNDTVFRRNGAAEITRLCPAQPKTAPPDRRVAYF